MNRREALKAGLGLIAGASLPVGAVAAIAPAAPASRLLQLWAPGEFNWTFQIGKGASANYSNVMGGLSEKFGGILQLTDASPSLIRAPSQLWVDFVDGCPRFSTTPPSRE